MNIGASNLCDYEHHVIVRCLIRAVVLFVVLLAWQRHFDNNEMGI